MLKNIMVALVLFAVEKLKWFYNLREKCTVQFNIHLSN